MTIDARPPSAGLAARFEAENREPTVRGARTVAWIVLLVLLPFYLVDASRFPEQIVPLGRLRLLSAAMPVALLAMLATAWGQRRPRALTVLFSVIGAGFTTAQMGWTGEHASPYFAGLGLGILLPALILPWPPVWTWLNGAAIVATYLVTASGLGFETRPDAIANNLFSYLATVLIAGVATVSRERLRWREFLARQELEASQEKLREEAATSRALAEAGREMIGLLDTPRVLDRLCELASRTLGCDESHTILRDRASGAWRCVAQYGDAPEQWAILRSAEATPEEVAPMLDALSREGFVQFDVRAIASPGSAFEAAARAGITAVILVPLHAGQELIGVQGAGYRSDARWFDERQQKLAVGLAHLASMALANARLHEELARQGAAEREARALAESASRAKDEFLATLSHELRTPLNVILGYLEILDDGALAAGDRDAMLGRARQVSRQLFYMITDTLEISRLQGGQAPPQFEDVPLSELLRELRAECDELPRDPNVELRWEAEVPAVRLATDRRMLLIVMRNLVGNALKFTPRGAVTVDVTAGADGIALCVTDTGVGIPPDARDRIFEMFQQVDASDRRRFGGVGLGLYIVQRFCTQIGATIELESELGRGSRFVVRFPGAAARPSRDAGRRVACGPSGEVLS
jgi:signal transduction histidine kinase